MDNKTVPNSDVEQAPRFLDNLGSVDGVDPGATVAVPNPDIEPKHRFLDNLGSADTSDTEK